MKIKRYNDKNVLQWHLIDKEYDYWVTIERLLEKYPAAKLTEKQLTDRLWKLDNNYTTGLDTVYLCASTPVGKVKGRAGKQQKKKVGFMPTNIKLGVLGF